MSVNIETIKENKIISSIRKFFGNNGVVLAFVLAIIISAILSPNFATKANILNILRQSAIIGTIALGMTLIIILGGIDLSVGSVLVLVGVINLTVINLTGSIILGIIACMGSALILGGFTGILVTKGKMAPFIATLGMMAVARSLSQYVLKGGGVSTKVAAYANIANGEFLGISFSIYYFIILTIIVYFISQRTSFGRYIYSIGSNEKATLLSGVNVDKVKICTYMFASLLVAFASIIETSRLCSVSSTTSGVSYELDAIAAVVIGGSAMTGGRGGVIGTFFGVLILGVLSNMLTLMGVSPFLSGTVKGVIIVISVLIQSKKK